jgi:hypothetical protein
MLSKSIEDFQNQHPKKYIFTHFLIFYNRNKFYKFALSTFIAYTEHTFI